MPYRKIPVVVGEVYHVFNRSVAKQPIFLTNKDYQRAIECIKYYQHGNLPLRFSHYIRLPNDQKGEISKLIDQNPLIVEILAFCLMPNHIHFLLKGLTDNGVIQFMSNFQNSYAKYFNLKTDRSGTLFQPMFKAVRIESEEQLIHVSRYIHLNPITAYILRSVDDLENYPWSSYSHYVDGKNSFIEKSPVLSFFKNLPEYKKFMADQVDYQRELNKIRHLALE